MQQEQLVGDFRDVVSSNSRKLSFSDKEETLNGKFHILRHCEDGMIALYIKTEKLDTKLIIFAIHVLGNKDFILETALKDIIK